MGKNLFSVPIFFVLFRETLEAAIIVSVLLSLVEQLVRGHGAQSDSVGSASTTKVETESDGEKSSKHLTQKQLLKKLRIQIWAGALTGLIIALAIGAAFIAVWFTKVSDLWASSEELWEGIFSLIAALMIFPMALAMLKVDKARAKWRIKMQQVFEKRNFHEGEVGRGGKATKYALFILPLVTVLREGLEAVVFVGGVSLGQPATSIPIAAIVGLICGFLVGLIIYFSSKRVNISIFLVISTAFLMLIGAGLFSKSVGFFQTYEFNTLVGGDVAEAGNGPGSYRVQGNVWHLTFGNPESKFVSQGWTIFNAIFGWTNNATIGTILAYVFYWLACIAALVYLKFKEGRFVFFGRESKAGRERRERREAKAAMAEKKPVRTPSDDSQAGSSADGSDKRSEGAVAH